MKCIKRAVQILSEDRPRLGAILEARNELNEFLESEDTMKFELAEKEDPTKYHIRAEIHLSSGQSLVWRVLNFDTEEECRKHLNILLESTVSSSALKNDNRYLSIRAEHIAAINATVTLPKTIEEDKK